jgi:hypothetical protein
MSTIVLGRPGAHARRLARRAMLQTALWAGVAVIAATGTLLVGMTQSGALRNPALGAGIAGALAGAAMTSRYRAAAARASAGVRAEKQVARALQGCGLVALVHGATLSGGDADHVALGPVAVVVETKYGRGAIMVEGDKVRVGRRILPRNPLGQVRRQASLVAREIGRPVDAVVCVSEGTGAPRLIDGVWVCGPRDLVNVFSRLGNRVGRAEAETLAGRLASRVN